MTSPKDIENIIVGVSNGRPVKLSDVAKVTDGPDEKKSSVYFKSQAINSGIKYQAVTLSIAKRKGANATKISKEILSKVESLKGNIIPSDVNVTVARDYGKTAKEKSDELLFYLLLATVSVAILIAFTLDLRESIVVLVTIPVTLALTMLVYYLYGHTLNRITLFALIFSIGILVDDAIVVIENINRHCL
ncbi:MAG: efflux RND transporter permease subunit, partial [Elusimicrobia bacterium]|nr:efflux RND transporter permease subunit [Elusimicrobiota bacterium]